MNPAPNAVLNTVISKEEISRYSRQLILDDFSLEKQQNIKNKHIVIYNTLPTASLYLAAAGFGNLYLPHETEENLQKIRHLNPYIKVSNSTDSLPDKHLSIDLSKDLRLDIKQTRANKTSLLATESFSSKLSAGTWAASFIIRGILYQDSRPR